MSPKASLFSLSVVIGSVILLTGSVAIAETNEPGLLHVSQQVLPGISENLQFRTINDAAKQVEPGGTVMIHRGTYREGVVIEKSGTAEKPIAFLAAPGERVVVTGADLITQWEQPDPKVRIYRTPWPYDSIPWDENHTHPGDERHLVIGRSEQVFVNAYLLHQVLSLEQLSRGSFFVDFAAKQLYVWGLGDEDLSKEARIEASTRAIIWQMRGNYLHVRGLHFRYAANHAQQGAAQFRGDHNVIEDCVFEKTNGSGASFNGEGIEVRRCTFQDNGQLGFGASRAHYLHMTDCLVRNNNVKNFDRGWEAGGDKITFSRGVVIENSRFIENRGHGLWFDIGNEDCEVKNCLFADNEDCGIFYEISYGLKAHDNVIVGNGFADSDGSWGASCGISLSSSPNCVIERNLFVGNKEGFNFREQGRSTPRIEDAHKEDEERRSYPIWNHDEVIRNNVFAYNQDAQVWGWFDIGDQRHWPAAMQDPATIANEEEEDQPTGLSLEKLNISFQDNLYFAAPGQGLFNWGTDWAKIQRQYTSLADAHAELGIEIGGAIAKPDFADITARDFRVPSSSLLRSSGCYPRGRVPGVRIGVARPSP